jgi:hypothetical protein
MSRFYLKVHNPKLGHDDTYDLDVDDKGWTVAHLAINGRCDPCGVPKLYENFEQDSIVYPGIFRWYMSELWGHARGESMSDAEIQHRLNRLTKWVNELTAVTRPDYGY